MNDRTELIASFEGRVMGGVLHNGGYIHVPQEEAEQILALLKEQKQKPGHWENDKYGNTLCSVCGGLAIVSMTGCLVDRHLASYLSDYCPHCGAKMDKGVTQDD